jgi:hypothetical protein
VEIKISKEGKVGVIKVRDAIFIVFVLVIMDMKKRHVGLHGRRSKKIWNKMKKKVKLLNPIIILFLIAIFI